MSQDIVLVSNASMDLFPWNNLSDFRVRLPQPVTLDQSYRVALTRISYTKSYFNYDVKGGFWVILSDTKEKYVPDKESINKCKLECKLLPGYYTPQTFIDMINIQVSGVIIGGTDRKKSDPVFKLKNGFLFVEPGSFENASKNEIKWELLFDNKTNRFLGIDDKDPEKQRPVFMNQGLTDLFVYSDLVYPTIVGDSSCELLTILDGQTEKDFGAHCCEIFEDAWYHPLAKTSFQEIRIYIRTDTGEPPNFRFGRVNLRLSFKKDDF